MKERGGVIVLLVAVMALAAALVGCDGEADAGDRGEVLSDADQVVEFSQEGTKSVTLEEGQRLAVLVPTNSTIPYNNVLMEQPEGLEFVEMRSIDPNEGKEPVAGAGYTAVWLFDATDAGEGLLRIQQWPLDQIEYNESDDRWYLTDPEAEPEGATQAWDVQVRVE